MESQPNESLSGKARDAWGRLLEHLLSDECSLVATTRAYRWSVTGPHFHSLHKLFDEQRRQLDAWVSQLFQRTRDTGAVPPETIAALERPASQPRPEPVALPANQMIDDLLARHEELSRKLRENLGGWGDPPTEEVLRRLADFHDTTAWMLRMLLEGADSRGR